jgi:hypothetical protein
MKNLLFALLLTLGCASLSSATIIAYIADGSTLYKIDPTTGATISSVDLDITGLRAMTFSSDGTLYGMFSSGSIFHLGTINTTTGTVTLTPQTATIGGFSIAFDGLSLYELDRSANVTQLDPTTGAEGATVSCNTFGLGMAFGGDGQAWRGDFNGQVHEYALGGSCTGSTGGSPGSGSSPKLAYLSYVNGTMYALDPVLSQLDSFDGSTFPAGGAPSITTIGSVAGGTSSLAVEDVTTFTPEPAAIPLMGSGIAALAGFLYWRRRVR